MTVDDRGIAPGETLTLPSAHPGVLSPTGVEHEVARRIAAAAGDALLRLRRSWPKPGDTGGLRDRGDRTSHALILHLLRDAYPEDPILSEEGKDDPARLDSRRVWIVDPLDGTREFAEGRADWAIHVALAVDGRPAVGAVALPSLGLTASTARPPRMPPASRGRLRLVVSRTRAPEIAVAVAARLGAEVVEMGSAGAKTMAVARGEADVYLHAGGQYEWDSAAPVAVALAAGLHVSRLDGSPLRYNRANPWLPDQLVCRPELAPGVLAALAASR
ncbi:MAG: 3'(2'),5'-bisphosphate nucleotidase CysQ [Chloroflexi bacterium]|nr:3'(2'),5'-bisphosphate nucleotidase CysQ [Chloroflexota bacterium]